MSDLTEIIEQLAKITSLSEDDMTEVTLQDEIVPEQPVTVVGEEEKPAIDDNMSLADQFDAKARIARALEALQAAVEEFKNATAEKVDLLKDQALTTSIEQLDAVLVDIENGLASGSNILGDTQLNDPFKAEMPEQPEEKDAEEEQETEADDEEEDAEELEGDYDFDATAGLDLLADED